MLERRDRAQSPVPGDDASETLQRASVALLGLLLVGLSSINLLVGDGAAWMRVMESGLPVGLSLVFLAFGVFLWERNESPESMLIISAWGVSGSIVTGALAVWLVAVITFQDVAIDSPLFVVTSSATVGATFGGAAGYYHARLLETTVEIRRQNVRLDEFASIVSHDLRNPLSVAMGGLQLARETGDDEDYERVERAHRRMERMIDELLSLAQEGRDLSDLKHVSLAERVGLARQTVDSALDVTVVDDVMVRADPERLAALLENLFRNAAEHAGAEPSVTVGALDGGAGFYVADDGDGIPDDERAQIFDHGFTTNENGTGLGLSIVQRICEAHGWTVSVSDSEQGGARFEIRT